MISPRPELNAVLKSDWRQAALRSQFVYGETLLVFIRFARLADQARIQGIFPHNAQATCRRACFGISARFFLRGRAFRVANAGAFLLSATVLTRKSSRISAQTARRRSLCGTFFLIALVAITLELSDHIPHECRSNPKRNRQSRIGPRPGSEYRCGQTISRL
jgi:hypothetical protein